MQLNVFNLFPNLERQQRLDLVERLNEDAKWSINFGMMLGCSVLIAGLGLLKNSIGVIIGAMLVAPLMTPLIAGGLAIVQGNVVLLRNSATSTFYGVTLSLAIGIILQWITPNVDLTLELMSRGSPNILDLFIAFFAGIAAAYAIVRPNLSGAMPGVAVAVALVPPLAACGIALGDKNWPIAMGSSTLFLTNLFTIILASALVFRGHGLHISQSGKKLPKIIVRSLILLLFGTVLLVAPLGNELAKEVRKGQSRPLAFPVSRDVSNAINERVNLEKGVQLAIIARAGVARAVDVGIFLTAEKPVDSNFISDLKHIVSQKMGKKILTKVVIFQAGEVKKAIVKQKKEQ